jgi:hypothetical protein
MRANLTKKCSGNKNRLCRCRNKGFAAICPLKLLKYLVIISFEGQNAVMS